MVKLGLESFLEDPQLGEDVRLGLLTNQASVSSALVHNRILLQDRFKEKLTTLYSPQHGFYSEKQDNMIESESFLDEQTGLKVYSLYGDVRKPTPEMMSDIDVLLVDLQDVGTRVYTFLYTMTYCMEVAAELSIKVVVLDRPNPVGGNIVEGNLLHPDYFSFVGLYPLPMRHGLTFGELALFINDTFAIGAELEVRKMEGWTRSMFFRDTGLPWVFPSPNMVTPETAMVYPGQVIWEGTNISEGRGTTLPFELFGAPFIDQQRVLTKIDKMDIEGCFIRPLLFQPTSGKWAGEVCKGFQLHVTNPETFKSYRTSLAFYQIFFNDYPEFFRYKEPPYEYEYEKLPMDLILGSSEVRKSIEDGISVEEIEKGWSSELKQFISQRESYLLYENE